MHNELTCCLSKILPTNNNALRLIGEGAEGVVWSYGDNLVVKDWFADEDNSFDVWVGAAKDPVLSVACPTIHFAGPVGNKLLTIVDRVCTETPDEVAKMVEDNYNHLEPYDRRTLRRKFGKYWYLVRACLTIEKRYGYRMIDILEPGFLQIGTVNGVAVFYDFV